MRDVSVWVVGVCLLALVAPLANAELVTINIEGVVDTVDDSGNYLEGQVNPGDIITGWYTYDTDTPDSSALDYYGLYQHGDSPAGMFLEVQGYVFQTDWGMVDLIVSIADNDETGDLRDAYTVRSYSNLPLEPGITVGEMAWLLRDYTATALDSIALTSTAPDLVAWETNYLLISGTRDSPFSITGHVTSAFVIPEPCTLLFVAAGALAAIRRVC